jgi:thiol-disulfide isomerase/thioredoxin
MVSAEDWVMARTVRRWSCLAVALPFLLGACGALNGVNSVASVSPQRDDLEPGSSYLLKAQARHRMPALSGDELDGTRVTLSDLRGQVLVLNVWASWCAPCIAEAPNLAAVWKATSPQGVRFLGIDIKDERSSALSFQRNRQVPYPSVYDQPGAWLLALRGLAPQSPPTTLLIDRAGRIAARFPGGVTEQMLLGPTQALVAEGS